jgi:hypothetical protein
VGDELPRGTQVANPVNRNLIVSATQSISKSLMNDMGGMDIESAKQTPTTKGLNLLGETSGGARKFVGQSQTQIPTEGQPDQAQQMGILGCTATGYPKLSQAQQKYFQKWFAWTYSLHDQ